MPAEAVCSVTLEGRADLPCLERIHDLVDHLWVQVPDVVPGDRYAFETAVVEVAGNIIEHGGPDVRLRLWLIVHEDQVEAHFRDTGRVVELADAASRLSDPFAENGRGIALARAAADVVDYQRTGSTNSWRVVKRRSAAVG